MASRNLLPYLCGDAGVGKLNVIVDGKLKGVLGVPLEPQPSDAP
jgi:hypothetical protein